jgi:hypothetical protein
VHSTRAIRLQDARALPCFRLIYSAKFSPEGLAFCSRVVHGPVGWNIYPRLPDDIEVYPAANRTNLHNILTSSNDVGNE